MGGVFCLILLLFEGPKVRDSISGYFSDQKFSDQKFFCRDELNPPTSSSIAMSLTIFSREKAFETKNCYIIIVISSLNYTPSRGSTKR